MPPISGSVTLTINQTSDDVQTSNYGNNSFILRNIGEKSVAKVEIDVTGALYPDSIFDPFGQAGDSIGKGLDINADFGSGVRAPSAQSYIGAGGEDGYRGIVLTFDENKNGGFENGDRLGFSIDMDPNSVAGSSKGTLDRGSAPGWDVGGVSGAELIGSSFTVTFTDGSTATGQLGGAGNQAGSQGIASQSLAPVNVDISVNGLSAGEIGKYDDGGPSIIVSGAAGETARIVLTKGFIQPATNLFTGSYKDQLDAQLAELAAQDFPANNAVEFQTVDILLDGTAQDISDLFDFDNVADYNFAGDDQLPLGIVANVIDPSNDDFPKGAVTAPIYLSHSDTPIDIEPSNLAPVLTSIADVTIDEGQTVTRDVAASDADGDDIALSARLVDSAGNAVAGVELDDNGDGTGVLRWTSTDVSQDETYTAIVTADDGVNTPSETRFDITVEDNAPPAPVVNLTSSTDSASESDETLITLTLTASLPVAGDQSFALTLSGASGSDFSTPVPATLTIADGQTTASVSLRVADDAVIEGSETAQFSIAALDSVDIGTGSTTVRIVDNDAPDAPENPLDIFLVNTATDAIVAQLSDGMVLDASSLDGVPLSIYAELSDGAVFSQDVGSLKLNFQNGQATRTESAAPYALFGDNGSGDFFGGTELDSGSYDMAFEIFSQSGGRGELLDTVSISFTVGTQTANLAPIAEPDTAEIAQDEELLGFDVLANDRDPDSSAPLSLISANAQSGTVVVTPDARIDYAPQDGFSGQDVVTYVIEDAQGATTEGQLTITVTPRNDAPIARNDTAETVTGSPTLLDVLDNDSDPNEDPLTVTFIETPSHGTAELQGLRVLYTPDDGYVGPDAFSYTISDGELTSEAEVTVDVRAGNQPPVFTSSSRFVVDDGTAAVGMITATDPEAGAIAFSITGGADASLFEIDEGTGALQFLSPPSFDAPADDGADNSYEITLQADDGTDTADQDIIIDVTDAELPLITGQAGLSDRITGTDAAERIDGLGGPIDALRGGGGADIFGYTDAEGVRDSMRVLDYEIGLDQIDLGGAAIRSISITNAGAYIRIDNADRDAVFVANVFEVEALDFA